MSGKKYKDLSTYMQRLYDRKVCKLVLDAYHNHKNSIANSQAINYEEVLTGGSKAIYGDHEKGVSGINLVVDVELVAKKELSPVSFECFKRMMLDQYPDYTHQSILFMALQARMGRAFRKYGVYPLN